MAIIHFSTGPNHFSTIDHESWSKYFVEEFFWMYTKKVTVYHDVKFFVFWPLRCAKGISELGRVMKCRKYHPIWIGDDYNCTCVNASSTLVPKVASTSKMVCMIRSSLYDEHELRNTSHENVWLIQPTRWNTCHIQRLLDDRWSENARKVQPCKPYNRSST